MQVPPQRGHPLAGAAPAGRRVTAGELHAPHAHRTPQSRRYVCEACITTLLKITKNLTLCMVTFKKVPSFEVY